MKNLLLFEAFHNEQTLIFGHTRSGRTITVTLKGGRIETIDNKAMVSPFQLDSRIRVLLSPGHVIMDSQSMTRILAQKRRSSASVRV